ncbi:unnamed protein product [Rhizophagus irregularis]|nr:unnamed protein product [Rhizophagus irregularis]
MRVEGVPIKKVCAKFVPNGIHSVTSDFGLCCPADQSSVDKTLYGILPFVAPEVLRGGEFTKAADIYGFGMLTLDICKGERPIIPEYTPEPYAALMKRCWDSIPTNRPTTFELGYEIIQLDEKLEIEEEFSKEREDRWKHD